MVLIHDSEFENGILELRLIVNSAGVEFEFGCNLCKEQIIAIWQGAESDADFHAAVLLQTFAYIREYTGHQEPQAQEGQ